MLDHPTGQDSQSKPFKYLPALHASQNDDPAASEDVFPLSQSEQPKDEALALILPTSQALQFCIPVWLLNLPGRHGRQNACFACSWYEPFGQSLHREVSVSVGPLYLPGAQFSQPSPYVPAGHPTHEAAPLNPLVLDPVGHLLQASFSVVFEKNPTSQALHPVAFLKFWNVPGTHGKHKVVALCF